jgi:phosphoglycolate phosphatase-like HAD superfamily hydrolase
VTPDAMMVPGARNFLAGLADEGLQLYLASGTDHHYVEAESTALGVAPYFEGRIYGALDDDESHRKERIIQRILAEQDLHGDELLAVGDGPVEIREAVGRDALALGVASDEVSRVGWNDAKVARLTRAGAHFLVNAFEPVEQLMRFLLL